MTLQYSFALTMKRARYSPSIGSIFYIHEGKKQHVYFGPDGKPLNISFTKQRRRVFRLVDKANKNACSFHYPENAESPPQNLVEKQSSLFDPCFCISSEPRVPFWNIFSQKSQISFPEAERSNETRGQNCTVDECSFQKGDTSSQQIIELQYFCNFFQTGDYFSLDLCESEDDDLCSFIYE